jgi:DnaJ family protein C protein 3
LGFRHIAQLDPSSIDPHIKIANLLYYSARDYDRSTAQLRKCLHSDPDSKQCSKLLRRIKNYEKLIAKAKELRSKRQFNSANKIILGVGEEKGVMAEIEADISNLIKDGYINKQCPETLMAELQEMVCDSFIEVSGLSCFLSNATILKICR